MIWNFSGMSVSVKKKLRVGRQLFKSSKVLQRKPGRVTGSNLNKYISRKEGQYYEPLPALKSYLEKKVDMEPEAKTRKRARSVYVPKRSYVTPPIPYEVSRPDKFWRIKKGLSGEDYWRKRYFRRRITGRGDYQMNPEDAFGRRIGGWVGSKLGELAGGAIHGLVHSITGFGDYRVRGNALLEGAEIQNPNPHGGVVFRDSEYLGDIISSSVANSFQNQVFPINAALETTFPKLAQLMANFEQYVLEGMFYILVFLFVLNFRVVF